MEAKFGTSTALMFKVFAAVFGGSLLLCAGLAIVLPRPSFGEGGLDITTSTPTVFVSTATPMPALVPVSGSDSDVPNVSVVPIDTADTPEGVLPTVTPVPPTVTPVPPSVTPTKVPTVTETPAKTETKTATPTVTSTPTKTATATSSPTKTATKTSTPTKTPTTIPTKTATPKPPVIR